LRQDKKKDSDKKKDKKKTDGEDEEDDDDDEDEEGCAEVVILDPRLMIGQGGNSPELGSPPPCSEQGEADDDD
jgi:hypothetical protein